MKLLWVNGDDDGDDEDDDDDHDHDDDDDDDDDDDGVYRQLVSLKIQKLYGFIDLNSS